ncbi:MAG: extracellular solute-binding protein [Proteobacteria bacterium]|nr:extracellular solute-binding protein [Pseudomonadota bacterium]
MNRDEYKKRYEMNRRQFLKLAGAGGVALSSASLLGAGSLFPAHAAVEGKNAEERAINALKELKPKMKGDTLNILLPAGIEGAFETSKPWLLDTTGIKVNITVIPLNELGTKCMNLAVTRSKAFDMMLPSPYSIPDLVEAKLLADLTPWAKKYNVGFGGPDGVIPPLATIGMYKEKLYGLYTDGDENSLHLRRDWLGEPGNQKAFADKYGYKLEPPVLWEQLFDQIKFFTDKDKGTWGAWLYISPYYAKWTFMQLLVSQGVLPLDLDMKPQIAGPEGVKALNELIEVKPYLHPGATTGGWSEAYKAYAEGANIYAEYGWPSLIKYSNMTKEMGGFSKIRGKHMTAKVPGRKLKDGTILRPCRNTFSWVYTINRYSPNQEIAYLYSQWMYSPTISVKVLPVSGGYMDPYRYNHMTKELLEQYTPYWEEAKEALIFNINNSYPELQIRGCEEYQTRLDEAVIAAIQGLKKPEAALKEVEQQWDEITERYGREEQKEAWKFVTSSMFGEDLRKAMNLGNPPPIVEELLSA